MMDLTEQMVAHVATQVTGSPKVVYAGQELDLSPPWRRATMLELIAEHSGHGWTWGWAPTSSGGAPPPSTYLLNSHGGRGS